MNNMAEQGKFWSVMGTKILIKVWRQDSTQKQLHRAKRNDVFAQIVATLAERGYQQTVQQCCTKLKALKKKHQETADRLRQSSEGRESDEDEAPAHFPFFDKIDSVMGG